MGTMATMLMVLGYAVALIGGIWFLVVAFKESALWGVLCLLIPFAGLVFLIKFWDDAKKPFYVQLCAIPFYVLAFMMAKPH